MGDEGVETPLTKSRDPVRGPKQKDAGTVQARYRRPGTALSRGTGRDKARRSAGWAVTARMETAVGSGGTKGVSVCTQICA